MTYPPPYTISPAILNRVAAICEAIGRLTDKGPSGWPTVDNLRQTRDIAEGI